MFLNGIRPLINAPYRCVQKCTHGGQTAPDRTPRSTVLLLFLLHRYSNICVRGEPDLVSFDFRNEAFVDEVMVALVGALAAFLSRQLDATAFDPVHSTDMHAVSADDFHMLFDVHWSRPP